MAWSVGSVPSSGDKTTSTVEPQQATSLALGPYAVTPPVVLAPMAGITNVAYRTLCRETCGEDGAGLYVSEMVTARGLVERDRTTLKMIEFGPDESPRSLQLYAVDPKVVGEAVRMVVAEGLADHIDLNFGCPVPKVTRKGGGAALPYKRRLFAAVVTAAVEAASSGKVPVTVKMRKGLDQHLLTYLEAGRIAQDVGVTWVALHGRTAAQGYSGTADRAAIASLVEALDIPVLGNGDIWSAADALQMQRETGCAGVVVGRGCLGRPWLFRDLSRAFAGRDPLPPPDLAEVARIMRRHGALLAQTMGEERGMRDLRKHMAWYLKGFAVGSETRQALGLVSSLSELDDLLASLDQHQTFPLAVADTPRGRTTAQHRLSLPTGWLDDPDALTIPDGAEVVAVSGG
jgi:nifR3 family TIM-barrel protein